MIALDYIVQIHIKFMRLKVLNVRV